MTITLVIEDPGDHTPDMSTAWDWSAQIRVLHTYHSTLVNTFSVKDEYTAPVGDAVGYTDGDAVPAPLRRTSTQGKYRWDLYSKSPFNVTDLPRPPDVPEPEPWPPTDQIRTWLYGDGHDPPASHLDRCLPVDPAIPAGGAPLVAGAGRRRHQLRRRLCRRPQRVGCREQHHRPPPANQGRRHHCQTSVPVITTPESPIKVTVPTGLPGPPGEEGPAGPPGNDAQWVSMTQAQYDALPTKDPNTLYVISP